MNESSICRVCKKEIVGEDGDVNLHFADTSGLMCQQNATGEQILGNDSSFLEMLSGDKTPGGTQASNFQNNPKAFKLYKQRAIEL